MMAYTSLVYQFKVVNKTYIERKAFGALKTKSIIDQSQDLIVYFAVFLFTLLSFCDFLLLLGQLLLKDGNLCDITAFFFANLLCQ